MAGEYAFLYAAGLGPVTNAPVTGAGGPASPLAMTTAEVTVTLAGAPCQVPFAGFAPGLAGVYQVNFLVPNGLPSGSQELILTAGAETSSPTTAPVQ